jgi:hypothetical protein
MRRAACLAFGVWAVTARAVAAEPDASSPPPATTTTAGEPPTPAPAAAPATSTNATPPSAEQSAPPAPAATTAAPAAKATPVPAPMGDLQSPEQVDTRYSAYTLPRKLWAFNVGAFGIGGGDVFAELGAAYGLGAGLQLEVNLAHLSVGLMNLSAGWHFIDTRYFDLGARVGIWYGRGKWFWPSYGRYAHDIVAKIDALNIPLELTASSTPTRWLELDLSAHYGYAQVYGASQDTNSLFVNAQLGVAQFFLRPTARVFVSDDTSLEISAKLPLYSAVPFDKKTVTLPFSDTWTLETGVRSRLARRLFGNIRLHYGAVPKALYGSRVYPSFDVEFRL